MSKKHTIFALLNNKTLEKNITVKKTMLVILLITFNYS